MSATSWASSGVFLNEISFGRDRRDSHLSHADLAFRGFSRAYPDRLRIARRIWHGQFYDGNAPDSGLLRLTGAKARRDYKAMRAASTADRDHGITATVAKRQTAASRGAGAAASNARAAPARGTSTGRFGADRVGRRNLLKTPARS